MSLRIISNRRASKYKGGKPNGTDAHTIGDIFVIFATTPILK